MRFIAWSIIICLLCVTSNSSLNFIGKKTLDIAYLIAKTFFGDETCHECTGQLKRNPEYFPYANGCGSYGIHIQFNKTVYFGFDDCCNRHDMCYQDCMKFKDECDEAFMICMRDFCRRFTPVNSTLFSGCQETLVVAHRMVRAFGCSAYKQSKKLACKCV